MTQINTDSLTLWMRETATDLDHYYEENHKRLYDLGISYRYRCDVNNFVFDGTKIIIFEFNFF